MTTETLAAPAHSGTTRTSRARTIIPAAALALGSLTSASLVAIRPWGERDALAHEDLAPIRDNAWLGMTLDGLAFAIVGVSLALVVCHVVRSRGSAWANVGAVLTSLGGIAYGMGAYAFATLAWHATDPTLLSATDGSRLLDHATDNPGHGLVLQMAGFLLVSVGALVAAVALLRARTITRWLPIALIVLIVAQFTPVSGRVLDMVQVALMLVLVGIAGAAARAER